MRNSYAAIQDSPHDLLRMLNLVRANSCDLKFLKNFLLTVLHIFQFGISLHTLRNDVSGATTSRKS